MRGALDWFSLLVVSRVGLYVMIFLIPIQFLVKLPNDSTLIKYVGWFSFPLWIVARHGVVSLRINGAIIGIGCILSLAVLSFFWSPFGDWILGVGTIIQLIALFIMISDLIRTGRRLEFLLKCLFVGTCISAIYAVSEYVYGYQEWRTWDRVTGGFGDANYSSLSYVIVLPFALYLLRYGCLFWRVSAVLGISVLLGALALGASRTAILSLFLLVVFVLWNSRNLGSVLSVLLPIVSVVLIAGSVFPRETIFYRVSEAQNAVGQSQFGGRSALWSHAIGAYLQQPVTGIGLASEIGGREGLSTHSLYVESLVRFGVQGVLALAVISFSTWRSLRSSRGGWASHGSSRSKDLVRSISHTFILMMFFSLTLDTLTSRFFWVVIALGYCVSSLGLRGSRHKSV